MILRARRAQQRQWRLDRKEARMEGEMKDAPCGPRTPTTGCLRTFVVTSAFSLLLCLIASPLDIAQESKTPDRYSEVADKLLSLTKLPLSDCRWHTDTGHPEEESLSDSTWKPISVGASFESGVQVFRCWFTVPQKVHGYDVRGANLKVALDLQGDGMTMLSVYSNGYTVYRGNADTLEPVSLTTHAQPDQRFLIAVRLEVGDQPRKLARSEILIEPPAARPDPTLLRLEILSLQPILQAYPDAQRQKQLDSAVEAVDFSKLDAGDQAGFDVALRSSQDQLQGLQPWVRQFKIRAVGNSHIDMAWLWPWTETVEVVRNTFRSALDMMHEYPTFHYSASSARAYEWMEEKYPQLFQEIQQRVKEGRWEVVGGMWVEPDLNMPGGESLTRQILIGKRYFKKKFGVDVKIGWNPDSFGYSWQLPQIYKKSGIDYFVTQKLLWAHEFTTFPYKLFWWEAPDGSKLLTYFPHDYGSLMEPIPMAEDVAEWTPSIYHDEKKDLQMMYLYGVGDHGGGPTRTMLDQATRLMQPGVVFPKVEFSTAGSFFSELEKQQPPPPIPSWKHELYFQYHRGVFTTQAETKKLIRHTEETLLDAEKYASLAHLYGRAYPQEEFTSAWKGLLFDQFHDIMPGSGIAVNYLDAKRDLEVVERTGNQILSGSLEEIAARIDTEGSGTPVVVYNSLSWPRTEVIEAEVQTPIAVHNVEVVDSVGSIVPSQLLANDPGTHRVRFLLQARVPAFGFATFFVRPARKAQPLRSVVSATSEGLESAFFRVQIDPHSGCISSLYDKRSKFEALAPARSDSGGPTTTVCGNLLQAFVDQPKEYDAWNIDADFEKHYWNVDKADEVKVMETGPLRAVVRVKQHFQNSSFVQDITLYSGVPRVDVKMQAEWNEKHILLKVAFPVNAQSERATYEIPFGSIERPTTRTTLEERAQFEVPAEQWADLSDRQHGLSLLNDCKYGYDAKGNVLRLSLLRSPTWPDPHADEGHHEFTYSLYPHRGSWREADTVRSGYELNYKLRAQQVQSHSGVLPPVYSFAQVNADNVVLTAMKWAEEGDVMILRFYEWAGKEADVTVRLPRRAQTAWETNLIEQSTGDLQVTRDGITTHTKPYEIKTMAVRFAPGSQP
jgi:alpha-mannosidase